jgi:ADP-ribosylglycohydrolase
MTREELLSEKTGYRQRAVGCLVGLAVGDALGDIARDDAYRQRYGIVTNLYDGARSTDDTEFAVLTARTLLDCDGQLTPEHLLDSWQRYILDQGGVLERGGRPLYGAVANLQRGILPPLSGHDNVLNYDDGAAMRIAPIGIVCAGDPQRAAELAEIEAQISHHADGIWAAQAVAASIAMAMTGAEAEEIVEAGLRQIPEDSWLGRSMARAMAICDEEGSIEAAWERLHTELWTPVHAASPEAIPQIYAVFRLTEGDFRQGMFWGCNFGRDADTIGAVIGALSGARHGISVIPDTWVEQVRRPAGVCLRFTADEDMVDLAERLVQLIGD